MKSLLLRIRRAVIRVGAGRGFVICAAGQRCILTAAHCLPYLPKINSNWDSTYQNLLGPLGCKKTTVWAQCEFIDPIADLALLVSPDDQDLHQQAAAYEALIDTATPLRLGGTAQPATAFMLGLDPTLLVTGKPLVIGIVLWVENTDSPILGGMSGSPIVDPAGRAIGLVSVSGGADKTEHTETGPNPLLAARLPAWLTKRATANRPRYGLDQ
jgi:hypothetical protein